MATMPMQPDADAATENQEPGNPAEGSENEGVEKFVMRRAADGSLSVYVEQGEDESAEQNAKPVGSPGEALQAALQWLKAGPSGGGSAEDQFQSGFTSGAMAGGRPAAT